MSATAAKLPSLSDMIYRKEQVYYSLMLVIGVLVYAGLGYFVYLRPDVLPMLGSFAVYAVIIGFALFMARGMLMGRLRGNAIRVSAKQLPTVHRQVQEHSRAMQLKQAPDIYVIQAGGLMNAFATRFLGRDFVVIYSDVLEMAMQHAPQPEVQRAVAQ